MLVWYQPTVNLVIPFDRTTERSLQIPRRRHVYMFVSVSEDEGEDEVIGTS